MAGEQGTVYVVATSHLDTQWRWTFRDTILRYLPATMRENFALFERFPSYTFSFEGAYRYRLMKEYFPADFERVKGYVAAGRWTVCGSSVDAGDVNTVSPESLVRQALYGNGFFQREFGVKSRDIFLPDCFGFGWALPSVAAHCGLRGFSTSKLEWGSSVGIPFSIGFWEGPDGSGLVAQINPGQYSFGIKSDPASDPAWIEKVAKTKSETGLAIGYRYFGLGDTGGAPDAASVELLEAAIAGDGPLRIVSAAADRLCQELSEAQVAALPRHESEFLLIEHGTGTYTANGQMKRWNRLNESRAFAAEAAATMADWLGALPYPRAMLEEAWTRFLANQMHDILPGTSIPEAYLLSWNDEVVSLKQFSNVLWTSLQVACAQMDTEVEGTPVVVFNPLAIERCDLVGLGKLPSRPVVRDGNGTSLPVSQDDSGQYGFVATLPPMSLSVFSIGRGKAQPGRLGASVEHLENERYLVELNRDGEIARIFDKRHKRELLSGPHRLELLRTAPKEWPAWTIIHRDLCAEPVGTIEDRIAISVDEKSAARVSVLVERQGFNSRLEQRISLVAGGDRVEIETALLWATPGCMLKAVFPLTVSNPKATYDLGLGTIERGINHERLHEVPAQLWADVTDSAGEYGVAILTSGKYGWDRPAENVLRLTLVHTPEPQGFECHLGGAEFLDRFEEQAQLDFGHHRISYAIMGHAGDWREGAVPEAAARFNQPPVAMVTTPHPGPLGKSFSFVSVENGTAAVVALKKAEATDEVVVRVQETTGRTQARLRLHVGRGIVAAREVNGMEEAVGPVEVAGGAVLFDLKPYQPRAFALTLKPPAKKMSGIVCKPLELPYNIDAISTDANRCDGDIDGRGYSFPAELIGREIVSSGITYAIGPHDYRAKNAVVCQGQEIELPKGDFNRLCMLACSVDGDCLEELEIDDGVCTVVFHDYRAPMGCWNNRIVDGVYVNDVADMIPPVVKDGAPLAWVATHLHNRHSNADEAYTYGYLFEYLMELPKGAKRLYLPDNSRLRVFAISLAKTSAPVASMPQPGPMI